MFAKDMKMSLLVRQYKQNWKKNGIMKNCDGVFLLTHQKMSFKKEKENNHCTNPSGFFLQNGGLNDSFVRVVSVLHYLRLRLRSPVQYAWFIGNSAWVFTRTVTILWPDSNLLLIWKQIARTSCRLIIYFYWLKTQNTKFILRFILAGRKLSSNDISIYQSCGNERGQMH